MRTLFSRVAREARRASPAAAESRTPARRLADIPFRDFCGLLEIRDKNGARRSFDPAGWFAEQRRFDEQRTGRDVVLKPRQIGFSTLELARDLWFCCTHEAANVLIVVHSGEIADQLFVTLRLFVAALKGRGLLPPTMYSNKREVVFRAGGAVRIVEAGNTEQTADARGRSGTVHRLHATELAFWKVAETTLPSVMSCVPIGGEVVIESTPNGATGKFYEHCMAAASGTSGYRFHFFPWTQHAAYREPVSAGFDPAPADEHEQAARDLGADDEQIAWWRARVADPSCGLDKALREFPLDPESCFARRDVEGVVVPEFSALRHVVSAPPMPAHAHCYVALDPGSRDKCGIVWAYWDFDRARLVVVRSWAERNVTTSPIADLLRATEAELWAQPGREVRWWDGQRLRPAPFLRVSDVDARLVGDLSREHGIEVATTAKDDAEAQLYAVRNAFLADKIEIVEGSGPLEEQLAGGRWNRLRTDWERSEQLGHLDCLAALIYLWRNVQRQLNPHPPVAFDRDRTFVYPGAPQATTGRAVDALNEAFAPSRRERWKRGRYG